MAADKSDIDCLEFINNLNNKSILVAADVKHHSIVGEKAGG
jgi:hypothetical protein